MITGSEFAAVVFGLTSAVSWGIGDFSGGLATRRTPVLTVVLLSQFTGMILLIALAVIRTEAAPTLSDILWGAGAGLVGQIGLFAFYRAMAIGQMGIAAPIAAVLSAAIPVVVGSFTQGLPDGLHLVGFLLALIGVWFISRPHPEIGRPAGLELAVVAGLGFGGFLVLIAQVHQNAVFWPLVAARVASITVMLGVILVQQRFAAPQRSQVPLIMFAGIMDTGGNAFFVLAAQAGTLAVAGVLSSLYPAATVVLALVILKEKLTKIQGAGILLVLAAIPMISLK